MPRLLGSLAARSCGVPFLLLGLAAPGCNGPTKEGDTEASTGSSTEVPAEPTEGTALPDTGTGADTSTDSTFDPQTGGSDSTGVGSTGDDFDCDPDLELVAARLGDILGVPVTEDVCGSAQSLPVANDTQHSDGVQVAVATEAVDFIARGHLVVDLPGDIPCGPGKGSSVFCTAPALPLGGAALLVFGQLAAPIDLEEPVYNYQFGFVADNDGDAANNYIPSPAYPADFWADTDRWFYVNRVAGEAWYPWASTAEANFQNVPSSARIIVVGDIIALVVSSDEIDVATARGRLTAFRHLGDYGASQPWSGDVVPAVGEPLTPWQ